MNTPFEQDIIKTLIDKGLLSLILLIAGYWISRLLEINKQKQELRNKLHESSREKVLNNIEIQLASFYYPIHFRIQKDNALWKLSPQLSESSTFPPETNFSIENDLILTNHKEIMDIIQKNIHLIEIDDEMQEAINSYVRHVTAYLIIRSTKSIKEKNPIDFGFPYPPNFEKILKQRMMKLQSKNNSLLNAFM